MENEIEKLIRKRKIKTCIAVIVLFIVIAILFIPTEDENNVIKVENNLIGCDIKKTDEKIDEYNYNLIKDLDSMHVKSETGFNEVDKVNEPKLDKAMIPVYYDGKVWRKADKTNKSIEHKWYDYIDIDKKQWANVVTVGENDSKFRDVAIGTEIPIEKITTFFVWIPRFAYSMEEKTYSNDEEINIVKIRFLKGNTNIDFEGNQYSEIHSPNEKDEMIVHPAFKMNQSDLTGIWIAKFEASSMKNNDENETYVKILPNVISWRNITIGESQYKSMKMRESREIYGWGRWVNSHLIKENEFDAVICMCLSIYGDIPNVNSSGIRKNENDVYDMYTGIEYNTEDGVLASTTKNVYGIYDLSGGAWEMVASYIECKNDNLYKYGRSSSNNNYKYFRGIELKREYSCYWDKHIALSESEKQELENKGEVFIKKGEDFESKNRQCYTDNVIYDRTSRIHTRI